MTAKEKVAKCRRIEAVVDRRIETGPLQINGDWPGYYLRGDDAMRLGRLRETLEVIFRVHDVKPVCQLQVMSDISVLRRVSECLLIDDEAT